MIPEDTSLEDDKDDEFAVESSLKVGKRFVVTVSLFLVFAIVFCFFYFRADRTKTDTLQNKIDSAKAFYTNEQYKEAANLYQEALKTQEDSELLIAYADCLYELGETDRALSNYYAAIDLEPENEMAYARIIAMYEANEGYEEINALLTSSSSQKIRTSFQNYMAVSPVFNYEGGNYNQVIPLKITAATTGDVYYTLNGTDPMRYIVYDPGFFAKRYV